MSKPEQNGMNRTQKDFQQILRDLSTEAQKISQVTMNMGTCAAHLAILPKQAAQDLLKAAEHLDMIQDELIEIANRIIDWENSAIKVVKPQGLVDANGKAL